MRASFEDARLTLAEFQDRLREKQWLRPNEKPCLFHVYMTDSAPQDVLPSINTHMQFSASDSAARNAARSNVVRAASMLLKLFQAARPDGIIPEPPGVFCVPRLKSPGFSYGLIAHFDATLISGAPAKPLTIVVCEHDLSSAINEAAPGFVRHWALPQSGDSFQWLTVKKWQDALKKPSFGKWFYGHFKERQEWLQSTTADQWPAMGCFAVEAPSTDPHIRALGAFHHQATGKWLLPDFWDAAAVAAWLKFADAIPNRAPVKSSYRKPSPASTEAAE